MTRKITTNLLQAYWESKAGNIYEVWATSRAHHRNRDKDYTEARALNMRTGRERILKEKDFDSMRRLSREESAAIASREYEPIQVILEIIKEDFKGCDNYGKIEKRINELFNGTYKR